MQHRNALRFTPDVVIIPLISVLLLWLVFWAEVRFGMRFSKWGIYPLRLEGLRGVLFGPFLHGSLKHLFNNSVPLFVLMASLFYFYRNIRWKVLIWGLLLTGLGTWIIARPAYHIGASGVIYMLAAFLFFKGIFSKQFQLTALSLLVVFLYGGLLWYLFPIDPAISWEGHASGFGIGFLFALIFRRNPIENKKYDWELDTYNPDNDPFLKHFDEDGNFIEKTKSDQETELPKAQPIIIRYHYSGTQNREEEE